MRSAVAAAGVVAIVATLAAPASGAPTRAALIRPGVGIGKVRLGMTLAQVRRAMGRHNIGHARRLGFAQRRLELTWWVGRAHSFTVAFRGRGNDLRVVLVATDLPTERTAAGIGPGTPWERVQRSFPNLQCRMYGAGILHGEYLLVHGNGRETVFQSGRGGDGWGLRSGSPRERQTVAIRRSPGGAARRRSRARSTSCTCHAGSRSR